MLPKNQDDRSQESKSNSQLKSSIVHKPFATGTINIFNPYRTKGSPTKDQLAGPKLYLDAQLESERLATYESAQVKYQPSHWLDRLLNPWSISAIAIVVLANLISGAVIWRNSHLRAGVKSVEAVATLGSANIASEEFMPLNLSTLSRLKMPESEIEPVVAPISPALAPINLTLSTIAERYYYILTEYNGDSSLTLAKQKVEQISLVNLPQGVYIYLGAYKDLAQAEQFITHLKQENFVAHIYPPD
ncbi:hypothetical protein C7B62_09665 [Pleurocapsa sp. CCALA 161]|uniref:hypothetical protein n=1 Tax=Pleurocapsa sp. CCALA 161 TaxID=2107688 RepID=UPI000D054FD4|nr:hypothetical protein [Pleurocapsa sp. CCALA 161]PSB10387.1 hypothetical protein C7B62_09665 [Pleurocapsa sp. CCALA 161]